MIAEAAQLTVDGREIPTDVVWRRSASSSPLRATQVAIMRRVAEEGGITATEAGLIVHRARPKRFPGAKCGSLGAPLSDTAIGCCVYCSTDGAQALKRLERRGLLHRTIVGFWEPVTAPASEG